MTGTLEINQKTSKPETQENRRKMKGFLLAALTVATIITGTLGMPTFQSLLVPHSQPFCYTQVYFVLIPNHRNLWRDQLHNSNVSSKTVPAASCTGQQLTLRPISHSIQQQRSQRRENFSQVHSVLLQSEPQWSSVKSTTVLLNEKVNESTIANMLFFLWRKKVGTPIA